MCCVQNYNRAPMMALAVPVAVRFLQQGNRELSRNMSSYLSLAAIAKAELLVQHTQAIIISVLGGRVQVKSHRGHVRPPTEQGGILFEKKTTEQCTQKLILLLAVFVFVS